MVDEKLDIVTAKHKELSEVVQKKTDYLNQTNAAIKQLRAERKKAAVEIAEIMGAIQAYGGVINLCNPPAPEQAAEEAAVAESEVASEPQVIEGEVVSE